MFSQEPVPANVIQGDLIALALDGRFDVIVHGCNCQCTMGAGIAKAIRSEFPEAFEANQLTERGSRSKLGAISCATIDRDGLQLVVVNAYTQFDFRGPGVRADYDAIRNAMREIKARFADKRIGYPKIGAGLARGDWARIARIINEELAGVDHTLVEFASS